jgi:hypothetical protein
MNSVRALIGVLIVGGAVYLGIMILPHYFSNFQFKDEVVTESKFASLDVNKNEEDVRNKVFQYAQSHNIPIKPEQIRVVRDGKDVTISAPYKVEINLIGGKQVILDFPVSATAGKANK